MSNTSMKTIKDYISNPKPSAWVDSWYANEVACPANASRLNTKLTEAEITAKVQHLLDNPETLEQLYTEVWGEYSPLKTSGNRITLSKAAGQEWNADTQTNVDKIFYRISEETTDGVVGIPGSRYAAINSLVMTLMMSFTKGMEFKAPVNSQGVKFKDSGALKIDWVKLVAKLDNAGQSFWTTGLVEAAEDNNLRQYLYKGVAYTPEDDVYTEVVSQFKRYMKMEEEVATPFDTVKVRYLDYNYHPSEVHAFLSILFSMATNKPYLTYKGGVEVVGRHIEAMFSANPESFKMSEELSNNAFFYQDLPGCYAHDITRAELMALLKVFGLVLGNKKGLRVTDNIISFEGEVELTVKEDGVYDEEGRRVINSILHHYWDKQNYFDYVSGFGGLVISMLNTLHAFEKNADMTTFNWYRKHVSKAILVDHTIETGAAIQGDRQDYDRYSGKMYSLSHVMPISVVPAQIGEGSELVAGNSELHICESSDTAALAGDLFDQLGLVVLPKGKMPIVDNRLIYTKWSDVSPVAYHQLAHLHHCINTIAGENCDWISELKELYPDFWIHSAMQVEKFLELLLQYAVILKTTKAAKLKRPITRMAIAAIPLGPKAMYSALRRWDNDQYSLIHGIDVILAPHAVNIPGQGISLTSDMGVPSTRQSSSLHFIELFGVKDSKGKIDWAKTVLSFQKADGTDYPIRYLGGDKYEMVFDTQTTFINKGKNVKTDGIYCLEGDIIATVGFQAEDGTIYYHTIEAKNTCFVKKLVWRLNPKLGNASGRVMRVRVVFDKVIGTSNDVKFRENVKMTTAGMPLGKRVVYNELNKGKNITPNAVNILPSDTMKCPDLLMGMADVHALCLRENYGGEYIKTLNSSLFPGEEDDVALVWNEITAAAGGYDVLNKWFQYEYAQNLWLHYTDLENNTLAALKTLYTNQAKAGKQWTKTKVEDVKYYTGADFSDKSDVECFYTNWNTMQLESLDGEKRWISLSNVLVFYKELNLGSGVMEDHFLQYSLCYAGTNGLRLVQPVKTELGSVREAVCECNTMPTVTTIVAAGVPGIYEPDPELAFWLGNNESKIKQWQHIRAMCNKTSLLDLNGDSLPVIPLLKHEKGKQVVNPFIEELLAQYAEAKGEEYVDIKLRAKDPYQYGVVRFEELAEIFSNVMLDFGSCHIYMPALVMQESEPNGEESLNGLVRSVLMSILLGTKETFASSQSKIKAALAGLATSSKFLKGCSQGQPGLGCKALGIFGIEAHELIIVRDSRPDSYYQKMLRLCIKQGVIKKGEDLDGVTVLDYRAPIIFVGYKKIRVVEPSSLLGMMLNGYQCGVHALASYISAGDHDGDIFYFVPLLAYLCKNVLYTTVQIILDLITLRTGIGALEANQEAYIGDHWKIKTPKAEVITGGLLQKKHFGAIVRFDVKQPESYEGLSAEDIDLYKKANKVGEGLRNIIAEGAEDFAVNVGSMYQMATRATIVESFIKSDFSFVKDSDKLEEFTKDSWMRGLSCPLFELYETDLGGYNANLKQALDILVCLMNGKPVPDKAEELVAYNIKEAGLNPQRAGSFVNAALFSGDCKALPKKPKGSKTYECQNKLYTDNVTGILFLLPGVLDELLRAKIFRNEEDSVGMPTNKTKREGQIELVKAYYKWMVTFDPDNKLRETSFVVRLCDDLLRGILPCILEPYQLTNINSVFYSSASTEDTKSLTLSEKMKRKREGLAKLPVSAHTPLTTTVYI